MDADHLSDLLVFSLSLFMWHFNDLCFLHDINMSLKLVQYNVCCLAAK